MKILWTSMMVLALLAVAVRAADEAPPAPENNQAVDAAPLPEVPPDSEPDAEAPPAPVDDPFPAPVPAPDLVVLEPDPNGPVSMSPVRGRDLITVSLDEVPVQDVVRMFSRVSNANIVAGTNLQGKVTVNLQDVEWEPALRVILSSVGLTMVRKEDGIFTILSREDMAAEPLIVETVFLQFTTVSNIVPVVRDMLVSSNASVSGFSSANAIVVQETAAHFDRIRDMVERLDIPRTQVFIEAKFVELNDEAIKNLGINWEALAGYRIEAGNLLWGVSEQRNWNQSRRSTLTEFDKRANLDSAARNYDMYGTPVAVGGGHTLGSFAADNVGVDGGAGQVDQESGRGVQDMISRGRSVDRFTQDSFTKEVIDVRSAILTADDFALTLSALKQQTGATMVSNPKIVVASGQTASILSGIEEPNIKVEFNPEVNQYIYSLDGFIPIGVQVEVTPVVNTEDSISVRIVPELSDKIADVPVGDGRITFPRVRTRRVVTDFDVPSGRTVAIGGLTRNTEREVISKVPLLGDIPLLGRLLFRHTHTGSFQDEVVIFVTVSMAHSGDIREETGIPDGGRLIHRHLIQQRGGKEGR